VDKAGDGLGMLMFAPSVCSCSRVFTIAVVVTGMIPRSASANDREAAFARIVNQFEKKAEAISNEAHRRKTPHAGTMLNEFRLKEFNCASLAYMLGKDDIFKRLSHIDEPVLKPRMSEIELNILAINAIEFSNLASAARTALENSPRDRIELWNLNCVGQHEISREHVMARSAPKAIFERQGDHILVLGDIDAGFFERFRTFVESRRASKPLPSEVVVEAFAMPS
jgi:hypothetical protein